MLLTAGVFWAVAIVWALAWPKGDAAATPTLEARVADLEKQLASMREAGR